MSNADGIRSTRGRDWQRFFEQKGLLVNDRLTLDDGMIMVVRFSGQDDLQITRQVYDSVFIKDGIFAIQNGLMGQYRHMDDLEYVEIVTD